MKGVRSCFLMVGACLSFLFTPLLADDLKVSDSVVRLPPLLVESSTGQPWLFCEIDGFEILSRCSKATTAQLVHAFSSANAAFDTMLPERLRFRTEAPQLLLFYDAELWPKARKDAIAQMLLSRGSVAQKTPSTNIQVTTTFIIPKPVSRSTSARVNTVSDRVVHADSTGAPGGFIHHSEKMEVKGYVSQQAPDGQDSDGFFSNLRLTDADIMVTFAVVSGEDAKSGHSALTYEAVSQVLTARVPRLPSWFITGFLSLYSHIHFDSDTIVAPKMSRSEVSSLEKSILPLREILHGENASAQNPSLWLAQSELFVRWGLDPRENRREAFWKFVEQTAGGKGSESLFAECFGETLESTTRDLGRYLLGAGRSRIVWPCPTRPQSLIELHDASGTEIARIRGEWERLEVRYVRKNQPNDEGIYFGQAHRTVQAAYDRGDRDPRLIATMGLLFLEAGDNEAARPLLEEATSSSVNRPRVYFELAKMRYEHALDRSRRNDGKIEAGDLVGIVDVIASAAKMDPPLLGNYELLADIWANSAVAPNAAQLALIEQGLVLFPTESELYYRAAILYKQLGVILRADELAQHALKYAGLRQSSDIAGFRRELVLPEK
jgi:hypothetical protein